jgi:hypothetical protein
MPSRRLPDHHRSRELPSTVARRADFERTRADADDIVRQRLAVSPAPALCDMDPVVARRGPFSLDITIDQHTESRAWNARRRRPLSAYRGGPLSRPRLRRAPRFEGEKALYRRSRTSPSTNNFAIRRALEEAGIEFIEKNGGGEGVRLKKPSA